MERNRTTPRHREATRTVGEPRRSHLEPRHFDPQPVDLIQRAREGDIEAFEALYRAHAGRAYALCLRLVADAQLAEDLTQEAFVRLWERLGTWRGESAFTTWFHRLVVNVVFDRLRADHRRSARLLSLEDADLAVAPDRKLGAGARLDLERAIETLPPAARAVFVLHDVEGYRHAEVAERIGIAEGTSKAHLHRARRMLREVLQR